MYPQWDTVLKINPTLGANFASVELIVSLSIIRVGLTPNITDHTLLATSRREEHERDYRRGWLVAYR